MPVDRNKPGLSAPSEMPDARRLIEHWRDFFDWRVVGLLLMALVGIMAVLGAMATLAQYFLLRLFDLDCENNLPTLFSSLILLADAFVAFLLGRRGGRWRLAWILTPVFAWMAVDEVVRLHERLEVTLNIQWQIPYLPILALAGIGWLAMLWLFRDALLAAIFWLAGATCWVISQVSEAIQWGGWYWAGWFGSDEKIAGYNLYMVVEEVLEMGGSSLFLIAMLIRLQMPSGQVAAGRAAEPEASATPSEPPPENS